MYYPLVQLALLLVFMSALWESELRTKRYASKGSSYQRVVQYPVAVKCLFSGCMLLFVPLTVHDLSSGKYSYGFMGILWLVLLLIFLFCTFEVFMLRIRYSEDQDYFTYIGFQSCYRKVKIHFTDCLYIDDEKNQKTMTDTIICYKHVLHDGREKTVKLRFAEVFLVGFDDFTRVLNKNRVKHKRGRHIM